MRTDSADEQVIDIRDVRAAARRAHRQWPQGGDLADFESDAGLGAALAMQTWDPARGASLRVHTYTRMQWACLDGVRERSWATRGDAAKHADGDLADVLPQRALRPLSLNLPVDSGHGRMAGRGEDSEIGDLIPDGDAERPFEHAEASESVAVILRALRDAGQGRYADVLEAYHLDDMSLLEIADALGVTESRVSQLHAEACRRARIVAEGDVAEQQRWRRYKVQRGLGRPIRELAAA